MTTDGRSADRPPWQQPAVRAHSQRLVNSFHHWTGRMMIEAAAESIAQQLFEANFVLVSHGPQADPIFNYGNQAALALWEFDWESFTQLPSRRSAEPVTQAERYQLLATAQSQGYISNYQGIRISRSGRRFWIEEALVWTVLDEQQQPCGQAATFSKWRFLADDRPSLPR
jgi:MEKHLA domain